MDWNKICQELDSTGFALIPMALPPEQCLALSSCYHDNSLFRNTINMRRYRFGEGEYKYFNYPLPPLVSEIRGTWYGPLASLANNWASCLSLGMEYPLSHDQFINQCQAKGQVRPTPLLLRYEAGGFNTLHQDLYGDIYFPFQVVSCLSDPSKDFSGGEFVLIEQVPRAQSKAHVIRPGQGDAVIFTTNFRPVKGSRGYYRARVKHGISPLTSGTRYALGIIFHDAV